LAIPYDRDKIELANLELQSKQKDIEHKKQLVLLKLAHDTGLPIDTLEQMQHKLAPIMVADGMDIAQRVELQALEKYKLANKYLLKKEYGSYLPNVGVFASYSYTSIFNGKLNTHINALDRNIDLKLNRATIAPNLMVGVALKWDIFNGFERNHNVHKAKITAQQLDNKIADTKSLLQLQLEKNKSNYDNQIDQLKIAQQKATIATNNVTSAIKQYQAGLISVTERLAAETDVYQQRLAQVESIMNQRKAAIETYQSTTTLKSLISVK
jgi:outer membrane protein TolC